MTRVLLLITFLFVSLGALGQSQWLKGKIVADSLEGFAINIVNFTKKIGGTNDERGYFKIPADVNDSIIFSSVQYQVLSIKVAVEDINSEQFEVRLYPIVQELDQVRVSNVDLSGDITKDTKNIKVKPHLDTRILGLPLKKTRQPTKEERRIYTAKSAHIDLLLNSLNGRLKKLKKLKEFVDLEALIHIGENAFTTAFFVEDLGLPENLISDFMYYCSEDAYFENLLENSKRLSLLEFFEEKAVFYKKKKEIE